MYVIVVWCLFVWFVRGCVLMFVLLVFWINLLGWVYVIVVGGGFV